MKSKATPKHKSTPAATKRKQACPLDRQAMADWQQIAEQRAAELAILNSVGEAMAKTLDVKTVTRIVGDKVQNIFNADAAVILLFNLQTNLFDHLYYFDGQFIEDLPPSFPIGRGGLTPQVFESQQPLQFNSFQEMIVLATQMFAC